jgi:DNA-binding GntR family transcriptional regulator
MGNGMDLEVGEAEPLRRATLGERVANRIRDMIIEGRLDQGERINETALGRALGVSRTPLREALRTLASEGLIDLRPAQGALVSRPGPAEIRGMLEVLGELEGLAGRLACERATDAEQAEALAVHREMMELYAQRDRMPYYKLNQRFHSLVAAMAHNPTLTQMQGNIQSRLKRVRFVGSDDPEAWRAAAAEHEEMARALAARDGARMALAMKTHLANTWARVRHFNAD